MKVVSIIIPHFNEWSNLEELLNSIPTDQRLEVIVIDDWSDNQEIYLTKFKIKYPNILFLSNAPNKKGAGAARNVGLLHASGEWLLFSDADDLYLPDAFEKISTYFNSSYDMIYFIPTSFIENSKEPSRRHYYYEKYINEYKDNKSKYNELRLRYLFVSPTSKLIRSNIIKDNNIWFEEIMYSNDILFSAKVGFYANEIFASRHKIYSIRESENSLTSSFDDNKIEIRFYAWVKYVKFIMSKLSKEDFLYIDINATPFILRIIKERLGVQLLLKVIRVCRENNIPIIDRRILNLKFLYDYVVRKIKLNKIK